MGLYLAVSEKEWKFAYFRNNVLFHEFEKGSMEDSKKTIPAFGLLENKYKGQL